ncbi:MAG: hypothetical protein A2583_12110 [Bdellovibrionales bacterium RIFOXYD1_FULL_53_11]|nr:MAG: hypothetical protein A2583_12110 [Bdellovibrionales bacterium RIFOXYD1_FULL_53_11]
MKPSLATLKSVALAILLTLGVSYASAAWQAAPAGTPPTCTDLTIPGCNPPINISTTFQSKAGALDVVGTLSGINAIFTGKVGIGTLSPTQKLDVAGTVKATGFQLTTGAGASKVLTSDASGNGTWQDAAGGLTNYNNLPAGTVAGYCPAAGTVYAPAIVDNGGCKCASGWTQIAYTENTYQNSYGCIKN